MSISLGLKYVHIKYIITPFKKKKALTDLQQNFSLGATSIEQQSPTFWHQGPVLWKTIFPRTGVGNGSGGNASDGEQQMKLCSLDATHLLLCSPVPNRPRTDRSCSGLPGFGDPCYRGHPTMHWEYGNEQNTVSEFKTFLSSTQKNKTIIKGSMTKVLWNRQSYTTLKSRGI